MLNITKKLLHLTKSYPPISFLDFFTAFNFSCNHWNGGIWL